MLPGLVQPRHWLIKLIFTRKYVLAPDKVIFTYICFATMFTYSRYLFLGLLMLLFNTSVAQTTTTSKPQVLALNHIAVHVVNLEKSTDFYENVLQLQKIPEPFKDGLHTWFTLGVAGQLHLIQGLVKQRPIIKMNIFVLV